jgi:hypothetical protein
VARHARVDDGDLGTTVGQGEREVGPDEPESAGDDAPAPGNGVDREGFQSPVSVGAPCGQTA